MNFGDGSVCACALRSVCESNQVWVKGTQEAHLTDRTRRAWKYLRVHHTNLALPYENLYQRQLSRCEWPTAGHYKRLKQTIKSRVWEKAAEMMTLNATWAGPLNYERTWPRV